MTNRSATSAIGLVPKTDNDGALTLPDSPEALEYVNQHPGSWLYKIDGIEGVFAFTSRAQLPTEPLFEGGSWRALPARELASSVPDDVDILININSPARWKIDSRSLRPHSER